MNMLTLDLIRRKIVHGMLRVFAPGARLSYSQFGEDLILEYLFSQLNIKTPTYLDIGANDPRNCSNTYKFYQKGSKGILVEPNPVLANLLSRIRPRDTVLNIGVGFHNGVVDSDYYLFPAWASGLNTFSKEHANYWETIGHKDFGKIKIEKVLSVKLNSVNDILRQHFKDGSPNFISLDVEGLDLSILQSINFDVCTTEVICVETMDYDDDQKTLKINEIIDFLKTKSYMVFADTRVNTIFCKTHLFNT